jgi:UDP-N-acetylmuramoyl-L-alanyl-D-glutamate--2,6-diaminopimelate ligase
MDAYWKAKRRLFEGLGSDAVAVVNFDDPVGELIASGLQVPIVSFGIDTSTADVTGRIEASDLCGSRVRIEGRSFELEVHSDMVGRHNVMNVVASAAVAYALGIPADAVREAVESFGGVPGRMQRVTPDGCSFSVFVDYAHTDDALNHALRSVRQLTPERLICVFGCGGDRDRDKRPRMATVAGQLADVVYVTSDNPRSESPQRIISDILPGFGSRAECRVEVHVDRRTAIEAAVGEAHPGDTVVIAGKGHETYQLVGDQVLHFDDVEVVQGCLHAVITGDAR